MARLAARFLSARDGTIAIIFGLVLIPAMLLVGIAIENSVFQAENMSFQRALDSGVVAGALINLPDDQRLARARLTFTGMLKPAMIGRVIDTTFSMDAAKTKIDASTTVQKRAVFGGFHGHDTLTATIKSGSLIARPQVRQLDLIMCIDGTGSMTPTLNAVKNNALNLEANINSELQRRGIAAFDAMRVRPIVYRDFGGNSWYDPSSGGWAYTSSGWIWVSSSDPNRGKYVGDSPPMDIAAFYKLPDQRTDFSSFVQAETAWGGGDEPESGLECINEAMNSPFAKLGDVLASGKKLTGVYPVIVVWTDANTHPPAFPKSLQNPSYPPESTMPRTHSGLLAKWNDATRIDQSNRLLVFFGGPSTTGMTMDPQGWPPVQAWPGYYAGGSLSDGNALMVTRIVDAISSKINQPAITQ